MKCTIYRIVQVKKKKNLLLYYNIPENSPSYFTKTSMKIYEKHGLILTWYV